MIKETATKVYERAENKCEFSGLSNDLQIHHCFYRSELCNPEVYDQDWNLALCAQMFHTGGGEQEFATECKRKGIKYNITDNYGAVHGEMADDRVRAHFRSLAIQRLNESKINLTMMLKSAMIYID